MKQFLGKATFVAAVLTAVAPAATITQRPGSPLRSATIYVRIYDYADIPSHILGQAKTHAARVFERAGFEVIWLPDPLTWTSHNQTGHSRSPRALLLTSRGPLTCVCGSVPLRGSSARNAQDFRRNGLNPEVTAKTAAGMEPLDHERGLRTLSVRIYPPKMSRRLVMGENVFGYALQPEDESSFGTTAIVFDDKAESLAKEGVASRSVTLGHIIAHEMGHLLLGNNSHSGYGIMHVPWRRAELKRAATGLLNFTQKEVQRIRKRLVARQQMAALRAAAITN